MTFDSDFDAIAGVTNVDPTTQAATYLINDDGGGDLEPLLDLTISEAGTLALFVAGVNGQEGCYQYKVEITAPTDAPTPTGGESLTGTVTEESVGTPISGATITILDGANAGDTTSTSANGAYRFDRLSSGNANVSAEASGYLQRRRGTFIGGVTTLNFTLPRATAWSRTGQGNTVFDMPTYISRVQIVGTYSGYCQNFVVYIADRLIVNEILGTCSIAIGPRYDGVHTTSGGVVETRISSGVSWSFTEVR